MYCNAQVSNKNYLRRQNFRKQEYNSIIRTFEFNFRIWSKLVKFTKLSFFFSGEGKDVTGEMTDPWKETTLQTILSNYAKTDIYNAYEFGLFYQALPKKTLHLKDEKCTGGKHSKIRLTGIAATNMNGDKLPMFVIGRSNKPRCFKGV